MTDDPVVIQMKCLHCGGEGFDLDQNPCRDCTNGLVWMPPMIINAPERKNSLDYLHYGQTIFLAGGITGVGDWQKYMAEEISQRGCVVFNPRRDFFPTGTDLALETEQVQWEHDHLVKAKEIIFWFAEETIQPITLFELGSILHMVNEVLNDGQLRYKPIFVGIHPNYPRRMNLVAQLAIMRPELKIASSLEEILEQWDDEEYHAYL